MPGTTADPGSNPWRRCFLCPGSPTSTVRAGRRRRGPAGRCRSGPPRRDRAAGLVEIEIGGPGPFAGARVLGGLGPAVAADDVIAAVAVDVADADAVPGQLARQLVADPLRAGLPLQLPPGGEVGSIGQE